MMVWDKSLETGVALVDDQHKELFRRINEILTASMNQQGKQKVSNTLQFLREYILKHFKDEQELHNQSKYPKAIIHKSYHDNFVRVYNSLCARYETEGDSLNVVLAINKTVVDWLLNHIQVHDKEFATYYRSIQ